VHSVMVLKQPVHTVRVLQPSGEHASNDLIPLPQLHFMPVFQVAV
jgi:hypothetical protein